MSFAMPSDFAGVPGDENRRVPGHLRNRIKYTARWGVKGRVLAILKAVSFAGGAGDDRRRACAAWACLMSNLREAVLLGHCSGVEPVTVVCE